MALLLLSFPSPLCLPFDFHHPREIRRISFKRRSLDSLILSLFKHLLALMQFCGVSVCSSVVAKTRARQPQQKRASLHSSVWDFSAQPTSIWPRRPANFNQLLVTYSRPPSFTTLNAR
jgi:hypothetical protein